MLDPRHSGWIGRRRRRMRRRRENSGSHLKQVSRPRCHTSWLTYQVHDLRWRSKQMTRSRAATLYSARNNNTPLLLAKRTPLSAQGRGDYLPIKGETPSMRAMMQPIVAADNNHRTDMVFAKKSLVGAISYQSERLGSRQSVVRVQVALSPRR